MKRGEIWLINLEPTIGAEISKKRPALIVNVDEVGKLPLKIILPITAWKPHYQVVNWMVKIPSNETTGLDKDSSADCFQARSLSERRMLSKIGEVGEERMAEVEKGLQAVFGL